MLLKYFCILSIAVYLMLSNHFCNLNHHSPFPIKSGELRSRDLSVKAEAQTQVMEAKPVDPQVKS